MESLLEQSKNILQLIAVLIEEKDISEKQARLFFANHKTVRDGIIEILSFSRTHKDLSAAAFAVNVRDDNNFDVSLELNSNDEDAKEADFLLKKYGIRGDYEPSELYLNADNAFLDRLSNYL